jgi:hypothetical protein
LVREERNRVLAPERENRLKDSVNVKPNPTTSHAQDVVQYPSAPSETYRSRGFSSSAYLPETDDSRRKVGLTSGHSAEPAAAKSSVNKYHHPQSSTTSLSRAPYRYPPPHSLQENSSYVHIGAPVLQDEPSSGSSLSDENDVDPVQPVSTEQHAGDGDEPQKAQQHQAKPSPNGGNLGGTQPPSTAISSRT